MITRKNNILYMTDPFGITFHSVGSHNISYPEHYHDFVEITYILSGKCTHVVDGRAFHMKHGDMLLINYKSSHAILGDSAVDYVNVYIKPEYVDASLTDSDNAFALLNLTQFGEFKETVDTNCCKVSFAGGERDTVENILKLMRSDSQGRAPGSFLALRSELNLLLINFFRKAAFPINDFFDSVSDDLLFYIRSNLSQNLTLSDIAERCSYNKAYFSRLFKAHTGMTFTDFLKAERMEKAKSLLLTTSDSVERIVSSVGYSDKTRFYKDFRRATGLTPQKYREK